MEKVRHYVLSELKFDLLTIKQKKSGSNNLLLPLFL